MTVSFGLPLKCHGLSWKFHPGDVWSVPFTSKRGFLMGSVQRPSEHMWCDILCAHVVSTYCVHIVLYNVHTAPPALWPAPLAPWLMAADWTLVVRAAAVLGLNVAHVQSTPSCLAALTPSLRWSPVKS